MMAKHKKNYKQYGLTLIEVALCIFILVVVTISLTDYIERNYKTLNLRSDADLMQRLEVALRQYIIAKPGELVKKKCIEVSVDDLKNMGLLGNYKQSKFYDSVKIYVKPVFSNGSKYFFAASYLITYFPDNNGTLSNEYNAIGRGQLINFIGEKGGVYSEKKGIVTGLTGGWSVNIVDYSAQEAATPVAIKSRKIYMHSVIPLTNNESEIISLACYNPLSAMECSVGTIHFSCDSKSQNDDQKLIFTYSGHDVAGSTLSDENNNMSPVKIDYNSLVYELKLNEFCSSNPVKSTPFIFKPIITPINLLGIAGKPFSYNYEITLERD